MAVQNVKKSKTNNIIAIGNPKGGVGKTATAVSIARIVKDLPAFKGKKILVIDTDPLGILTKMIISRRGKVPDKLTLLPVIQKGESISSVIQRNAWPQVNSGVTVDYICTNRAVSKLENLERFDLYRLKAALDEIKEDYFKIIIDCPANSNNLYFSSCIAAHQIIFPFGSIESLSGLEVTCVELCQIDEKIVDNLKILFTMQEITSDLTASLITTARQYLDFPQFETIIRRCDHFGLEMVDSQTTGHYNIPNSIAINDYLFLVEELFAADFKRQFKNKQRFTFKQTRIDERLWAVFYEASFLISNEREKARGQQPRSAMQKVFVLEKEVQEGGVVQPVEKSTSASRKILIETCLKACSKRDKIIGKQNLFYIAELLPGTYKNMKQEDKHRYLFLFHPECFENVFTHLFLKPELYREQKIPLAEFVAQDFTVEEQQHVTNLRKKMKTLFLTFIRDPRAPDEISYLVHFWNILREREYITRWQLPVEPADIAYFGGISSYLVAGHTLVVTAIHDQKLTTNRKNLARNNHYRSYQNFKAHLEDKLRKLNQ